MIVTDRHRTRGRDLLRVIADAVQGGVGLVQLRERDLPEEQAGILLRRIRGVVPAAIPVAISDRPALARREGTGLHISAGGPSPVSREGIVFVGRSARDEHGILVAREEGVAYLAVGPVFPTEGKIGHPGLGLQVLGRLAALASPVPVFAVGGVSISHVPDVIHAGAHGVGVCGAVLAAPDPLQAAEGFRLALAVAAGRDVH